MSEDRLPREAREALDGQLALLIARAGWQPFVTAPLLPPTPEAFPEAWVPSARGVGTVARRLLAYAGVPAARVRVTDYSTLAEERTVNASDILFGGIDTDRTIDLELHCAGDEHDLLGAVCHAVGGAWLELEERAIAGGSPFRGVVEADRDDADEMAEARASIAAVYLGFGIPAANAAHSARHGGYFTGTIAVTQWAVTMAGGLSVHEMVYLLAAQLTVRGRDPEVRLARRHLQTNQRADLDHWLELLAPRRDALLEQLGIPEPASWPAPAALEPAPLTDGAVDIEVPVDRDQARMFNHGRNVFRVRMRRTGSGLALGAFAGTVLGFLPLHYGVLPSDPYVFLIILAGAIAGAVVGRRLMYWVCSDSACGQRIAPGDAACNFCGGTVAGELRSADDRLAAEEALEDDEP